MRKSFKFAIIAAAAVSAFALTACSSSKTTDGTKGGSASGDYKVEVIAKGFQHDFWKAVNKGAEKAADELGAKITFVGLLQNSLNNLTMLSIRIRKQSLWQP